jgi:hypothetical protein
VHVPKNRDDEVVGYETTAMTSFTSALHDSLGVAKANTDLASSSDSVIGIDNMTLLSAITTTTQYFLGTATQGKR